MSENPGTSPSTPFIPYSTQWIDESDLAAVRAALSSEWLTQGPSIGRFEQAFADRHRVRHAVAVNNATAGLHIACLALEVGPGKLVWTSPNSFVASANCALYCGADIDFVDIDPLTRNMSTEALATKLAQAAHPGGRLPDVVIPVHFAGLACDLAPIRALADRYGFRILEDAAHATGASYRGEPIGSRYADVSVFSFHAVKIVTTAEGGMVTTQDDRYAGRLRQLRTHGITREPAEFEFAGPDDGSWYYEQRSLGYNFRMTDLQAALGVSQLARLESLHSARERLADRYDRALASMPLRLPARRASPESEARSSWHLYAVELVAGDAAERARVFAAMRSAGVGVNVHYLPIHLQPYYRRRGFRPGAFPNAEAYATRALSIPLYPALTDALQDRVVAALASALRR